MAPRRPRAQRHDPVFTPGLRFPFARLLTRTQFPPRMRHRRTRGPPATPRAHICRCIRARRCEVCDPVENVAVPRKYCDGGDPAYTREMVPSGSQRRVPLRRAPAGHQAVWHARDPMDTGVGCYVSVSVLGACGCGRVGAVRRG